MKRILREPLLHFLVLGALIFFAYRQISKRLPDDPTTIIVTDGQVQHLAAGFARTWQRPPTEAELKGLLDEWVREEIGLREAIALGLDKDDAVIRRQLRQKLEFVANDIVAQTQPTDADLNAYLKAHPASFRIEPRFTFSQVYLDPAKRGDKLAQDIAQLLARLNQPANAADPGALGDATLLDHDLTAAPLSDISGRFGAPFAAAVEKLPVGQWQGPVESEYGVHLVLVRERTPGSLPPLEAVRATVRREWENARRVEGMTKFYGELMKRYRVVIEPPAPVAAVKK